MEKECLCKVALEIVVRCELAEAACGTRHRPWLSLASCLDVEQGSDPGGVLTTTKAKVGIDELGRRRQVNVLNAELAKPASAVLEMLRGCRGSTEAEFQLAESSDGPDLIEVDTKLGAQGARLRDMRTAVVFVTLARFEPRHAGECGGKLCLLTGLAREPRGLVVFDRALPPVLSDRVITTDTIQQPRQDAERNPSTRCLDRLVDKGAD